MPESISSGKRSAWYFINRGTGWRYRWKFNRAADAALPLTYVGLRVSRFYFSSVFSSGNGYSPKKRMLQPSQSMINPMVIQNLQNLSTSLLPMALVMCFTSPPVCNVQLQDMYHNHPETGKQTGIQGCYEQYGQIKEESPKLYPAVFGLLCRCYMFAERRRNRADPVSRNCGYG